YPMEVGFKFDNTSYDFLDKITGTPTYIPNFDKEINPVKYFNAEKEIVSYSLGKETSAKFGVRKNYIEKAFYEKSVETDFNYENYLDKLSKYCTGAKSNQELFEGKHKAYFESWDNGAYFNDPKYIVTHDSNGLFFSDFNKYFNDFKNSFILVPIRDCIGYVAAEKTRIARRFFGSRRFAKPLPPNFLLKKFDKFDLNSIVNSWLISISRIKLLQETINSKNRLITYRFENLVRQPSNSMKILSNKLNVKYEENLLSPTLCGNKWLGNSQQGENIGINSKPNEYYKFILREDEINHIKSRIKNIDEIIQEQKTFEVDFKNINDKYFFDIKNQRKASATVNTWSLYCALGFAGFRKLRLTKSDYISLMAYLFSIFVMIYHFPRILKQKLFPGLGKQNYT
ncbi:hypothetical protein OAN46_02290, partial [Candidatus Pelagibacter sp.]|nr:hypothetical protein [Candidatus Pelagibacter sp.]